MRYLLLITVLLTSQLQADEPGQRLAIAPIDSAATGWTYPLRAYLPPGYHESGQRYPVLYATDAKIRFDLIADMLDAAGTRVIMIGVGTTGDIRREMDFVMPGARNYARFLADELIPRIDADYRTDPAARTLAGHSLAGLQAALMLLLDNPAEPSFGAYLVSDGSFWNQPERTRELVRELRSKTDSLPVSLFMTGATKGNIKGARMFQQQMLDANFDGLELIYEVYETNHKAVIEPSFRDGLKALYP